MKKHYHKEVFIFNINDRKIFLELKQNESRRHIILKLLCYLLNYDKNMSVEQRSDICKRYKPDLISEEHKIWGEAGQIDLDKIIKLGSLNSIKEFHIVKSGIAIARQLRDRYSQKRKAVGTCVYFHGFDSQTISEMEDNIFRQNIVEFDFKNDKLIVKLNNNNYILDYGLYTSR